MIKKIMEQFDEKFCHSRVKARIPVLTPWTTPEEIKSFFRAKLKEEFKNIRDSISCDEWASSFQTMGQYRKGLMEYLDEKIKECEQ